MLHHYGIVSNKAQQTSKPFADTNGHTNTPAGPLNDSLVAPKQTPSAASINRHTGHPRTAPSLTSQEPATDNWMPLSEKPQLTDSLCNAVAGAPAAKDTRASSSAAKPVLPPIV